MKNVTKRKTGAGVMIGFMAVATAAFMASCGNGTTDPQTSQIKRQWDNVDINGKKVTIKDMRTGANDQDLETMKVVEKLVAGLKTMPATDPAFAIGLVLEVEKTTDYANLKAYAKNRMGANIDYVLSDPADLNTNMATALLNMSVFAQTIPAHDLEVRIADV